MEPGRAQSLANANPLSLTSRKMCLKVFFGAPYWLLVDPQKERKGKNGSNAKESGPSSEISDLSSVDNTGLGYRDHTQGLSPTPSDPLFLRQFCRMLLQLRLYCKNGIANVNLRWPTLITRVPFHTKRKKREGRFFTFISDGTMDFTRNGHF